MSQKQCCLCTKNSDACQSLQDNNGQWSEVYNLVIKYFDATILKLNGESSTCIECWHTMIAFDKFQQSVLEAQMRLLQSSVKHEERIIITKDNTFVVRDVDEIVKQEEFQTDNSDIDEDKKPFIQPEIEIMDVHGDGTKESAHAMQDDTENEGDTDSDADGQGNESNRMNRTPNKKADGDRNQKITDKYIARWRAELECCVCKNKYPSYSLLQQHFQQHHPKNELFITCCERKLNNRNKIREHIRFHTNPNAHKCFLCNRCFSRPSTLKQHNSVFHAGTRKTNDYSSDDKRTPQFIDKLISKLMPELQCGKCNETRPTYTQLKAHFRLEHPSVHCFIICCGQQLKRRTTIERHISDHLDSYDCKVCNKNFYCRKGLMIHMRIHDPNTPSKKSKKTNSNAENNKVANRKVASDNIVKHGVVNNNVVNHSAVNNNLAENDVVNHDAATNDVATNDVATNNVANNDVANNIVKIIPSPKDFFIAQLKPELECVVCFEKVPTYTLLQQHFQKKHPTDEFYINCCSRKFTDRCRLKEHLVIHCNPNAYKCEICSRVCSSRGHLLRHIRVQHSGTKEPTDIVRKTKNQLDVFIAEWIPNMKCPFCETEYPNFGLLRDHPNSKHPQDECHIQCCKRRLTSRDRIVNHIRVHKALNDSQKMFN